jgi:hypothetical protein
MKRLSDVLVGSLSILYGEREAYSRNSLQNTQDKVKN